MAKATRPSKPRPTRQFPRIPRAHRESVSRNEFNRVIDRLNERGEILNDLRHNQDVQFRRIAQLQAELDALDYWDAEDGRIGPHLPQQRPTIDDGHHHVQYQDIRLALPPEENSRQHSGGNY